MKVLVVLVVVVGVSLAAAIDCDYSRQAVLDCMTDNGITSDMAVKLVDDAEMGFLVTMNVTPFCGEKKASYQNSVQCIKNVVNQCEPTVSFVMQWLDEMLVTRCADKNIRYDCLDLLKTDSSRGTVFGCTWDTFQQFKNSPDEERMNAVTKSAFRCQERIVRSCDAHTADVFHQYMVRALKQAGDDPNF
ncbi:uncharacterized protein LOC106013380 [Aplysia californica]|uniref:Uncharacterized protein LOC106013380 n=1 Tax=Aplysia californica TaxID=6500 RepID=A0ABM1AB96_APLCA|nr:uncharacterized protein LOC106013380 [Aplysia californica]